MAYVTPIGANPEQVEYRLTGAHGCEPTEAAHTQFSYHADGSERPLVWTGGGLAEVGITAGTVLSEDEFDTARALMAGLDPRTGERLVEPKLAVYDDAKVPLAPLLRAMQDAAGQAGKQPAELLTSVKLTKAYERAVRAVVAEGEGALLRADEAGRLADSAGLDVEKVWGAGTFAAAVANLTETQTVTGPDGVTAEKVVPRRRVVGNMGYDVSFTLPKSHSLLLAFADDATAASVERVYSEQVGATFDWLESQTAYGMRGKHGEGRTAETVEGSGFLGWSMVHRAARPVGDRMVGDPHWHVHVTVANMTKGKDDQWSTVAAGGRDLMRHAPAADHVLKALVRRQLADTYGVQFERSERTGAWEVAAIPDATLRAFSKRGASIEAMLRDLGFDPELATRRAENLAAAQTRHGKTHATAAPDATLRSLWQQEARELGVNPDQVAADALPQQPADADAAGAALEAGGDNPLDDAAEAAAAAAAAGSGADGGIGDDTDGAAGGDGEAASEAAPVDEQDEERRLLRDVVGRLLDPESGLTSSMRRFTRVDAIAAVADALPGGASDVQEIERLTDRALSHAGFVDLSAVVAKADGEPAGERRQLGAVHMRNAERFTTVDVVDAERVILTAAARSHDGQGAARVSPRTAALARSAVEAGQGFELSQEQADLVERLVTSDRAVDAVLGPPGTGKTTLMRAARAAWEAEGYVVAGAATAAVAAQNLQTESGIGARTVAQWVHAIGQAQDARDCAENGYQPPAREGQQPQLLDDVARRRVDRTARYGGLAGVDVLVLDEANLTDDRDRAVLYTEAARTGTKLVEVGDPKQLRGVGCGSLFGRVQQAVGGGELTANRRQRDEDERAAIASWRDGKYAGALGSWSERGRLVATETGDQALTAMVARWMTERAGAPDAHAEMRGVVMLAASNEVVDRLNQAAQAVRGAAGELGAERTYDVRAGRSMSLREGDHVLVRLNDRAQRMHQGQDVLNGYRGVVEQLERDGTVHVAWQQHSEDGPRTHQAALSPEYVAAGGLTLGYAMTGHKAEGLTVSADWASADGAHQGGTVLVYAPGMDEPGLHVATSRHRDRMYLFAGREDLESVNDAWELGVPASQEQREARVIAALAEQAKARSTNANDRPVLDDLGTAPDRRGDADLDLEQAVGVPLAEQGPMHGADVVLDQRSAVPAQEPAANAAVDAEQEKPLSRYSFIEGAEQWHVGWDPAVASFYAQVEPVTTSAGAEDDDVLVTIAGEQLGEVRTLAELAERVAGRVELPAGIREQLADDGPAELEVAVEQASRRLQAAEQAAERPVEVAGPAEPPVLAAGPAKRPVAAAGPGGVTGRTRSTGARRPVRMNAGKAAERAAARLRVGDRLDELESRELDARVAALRGPAGPAGQAGSPAGPEREDVRGQGQRPDDARPEVARKDDEARRQDRGRGRGPRTAR